MTEEITDAVHRRGEKLAELDQSFEAKCARAMETLNRQLQPRIDALRLVGPVMPFISERHRSFTRSGNTEVGIADCRFCNPPPPTYTCPLCDWETTLKWRMKMHNDSNPKWCQERAAKKIRQWSRHA